MSGLRVFGIAVMSFNAMLTDRQTFITLPTARVKHKDLDRDL